jgi:hypothetical protein
MFSAMRRLLGMVRVEESGDQVKVSGLPGDSIARTIAQVWGTQKITTIMFSRVSPADIAFNRFFAPDVVYAFNRIIAEKRKGHNIRALKKVVVGIYESTWMKDTLVKHPDILDPSQLNQLKWSPLEHQTGFFRWFNEMVPRFHLHGALLGAGPGTGKTFMGLALGLQLHADVVIVVCPGRAVKKVWEDTIVTQFKRPQPYWHSQMGKPPEPRMRYYIVHYDAQEKFLAFARTQHWRKPVILLDESHGMNEMESLRTQLFIQLCELTKSQYIVWESGTPVKALGGEMAPLFRTIDPLFDRDAQQRFAAIYGKASQRANDILAHRLGKVTYKVESSSVVKVELIHIQKKVRIPNGENYTLTTIREEMRRFIEERAKHYLSNMRQYERMFENALNAFGKTLVTDDQKRNFRHYEKAIRLIRKDFDPAVLKDEIRFASAYEKKVIMPALPKPLRQDFKDAKSVVKYYKLKVQGEALGQILGRKRAQCIIDMVPHIGLEDIIDTALKKTLMFTSYVGVVDTTADFLRQRGYRPLRVYGETNNELAGMVNEFARDEDANPMIATYQSLSSAVPLIMANTMVMANSPFRSFEYDQAVARCKRLGQDENVYVNDVVLDTGDTSNISSRTIDIMQWSRAQVDELLGFENEQLIATESLHERNLRAERTTALEAIADEELEEAIAPYLGRMALEPGSEAAPGWLQWSNQ